MKFAYPKSCYKAAFIILASIIIFVLGIYFFNFHNHDFSDSAENWGQFGDYIGGVLNPVFSFFSLIALLVTLRVQSNQLKISTRELKLSTQELKLTRAELSKSAAAQYESQLALNKQAEIANRSSELETINFLINRYEKQLSTLHSFHISSKEELKLKADLEAKKNALSQIIESTYNDLINERSTK